LLNISKRKGCSGVAGDNEKLGSLFVEELRTRNSIASDGLARFGAVGQTRGIAEVDVLRAGNERKQRTQDGKAAEAGVEDSYGGRFDPGHGCVVSGVSVGGVGWTVVSVAG